jgi:hypothetical protein
MLAVRPQGRGNPGLATSGLVGHHVPDMQRSFGFWFFYAGDDPA